MTLGYTGLIPNCWGRTVTGHQETRQGSGGRDDHPSGPVALHCTGHTQGQVNNKRHLFKCKLLP